MASTGTSITARAPHQAIHTSSLLQESPRFLTMSTQQGRWVVLMGLARSWVGTLRWGIACLLAMTEKEEGMVSQGFQTSFTPKLKLQRKRTDPQLELIHTHNHHAACSGGEKTQYFDLPHTEGKTHKAADQRSRWKWHHFSQATLLSGCSYYLCI